MTTDDIMQRQQEQYERNLENASEVTLRIARTLQAAAFIADGEGAHVGNFTPAPLYIAQAVALQSSTMLRRSIVKDLVS